LRPILESMSARIAALEHDNRTLRDTIQALAPVTRAELPLGLCPPGSALPGQPTTLEHAPVDVSSEPFVEPPATSWPARADEAQPAPGAAFYGALRGQR
jgi:hypothetical protein